MTPAWRTDGADLLLHIRLTPGSAREGIGGIWADADGDQWLAARVHAVPERGRANEALFALLAKRLACARGSISLESGETNRLKRLRIAGGAGLAAIMAEQVGQA
ncbi:MAG: DUF167 family protein [Sphingobium sp.]